MASENETFWDRESFAVVGHSSERAFPILTYRGLVKLGKQVYPVDPSAGEIEGAKAYPDFAALPGPVDAAVLETPKQETREWIEKAAAAGIRNVWIHQQTDSPDALALARKHGMNVRHGGCAVMYVTPGFTLHSIHKWIWKWIGRY